MMSEKAKIFGGTAARRKIMSSPNPIQKKHLGRSVSNFDQALWVQHRFVIVFKGNLAKFSAPPLLQQLVDTGDKFLAEASSYDLVWGLGFRSDDTRALQPPHWPGLNLLGDILTKIRHQLTPPPPLPPPSAPLASHPPKMGLTRSVQSFQLLPRPPRWTIYCPYSSLNPLLHTHWSLPFRPELSFPLRFLPHCRTWAGPLERYSYRRRRLLHDQDQSTQWTLRNQPLRPSSSPGQRLPPDLHLR